MGADELSRAFQLGGRRVTQSAGQHPLSDLQTIWTATDRDDGHLDLRIRRLQGYEVSGGISVNIEILEAQTEAKLKGEVTTRRGESIQFGVKAGERVYLAAQFVYEEHSIRRMVYAGPNCQPSEQSVSVLTPSTYSTLVAKYNV
jgi:hypothetical protein